MNIPKAPLALAEMAGGAELQWPWYLESREKEEPKEFQLWLCDAHSGHSPGETVAQVEASGPEVASRLVALYGQQQAWDLPLLTQRRMDLSRVSIRAHREAASIPSEYINHPLPAVNLLGPRPRPSSDLGQPCQWGNPGSD